MTDPTAGYPTPPPPGTYGGGPAAYGAPSQTAGEPAPAHQPDPYAPGPAGAAVQPYAAPAHHPAAGFHPAATLHLVSAGGRFGALLLDLVLSIVTFGIGWLIWSVVTWSNGQTPAKQLLGHVVADAQTGQPLDWGRMAMRELLIKGLLGWLASSCTGGIYSIVDGCMVFRADLRTLHDHMAGSVVLHR